MGSFLFSNKNKYPDFTIEHRNKSRKLHRLNGPAVIHLHLGSDFDKYYIEGLQCNKNSYESEIIKRKLNRLLDL